MRYLHLDVFTDTPFEGNQLAVYPDPAPGLSAERMQRIANEMKFSETTFVLPRERGGDVRMRIFTPHSELPMAGHPTIGTTFALAGLGVIAQGRRAFVFECGIGPVPVELEWDEHGLSFAWMTQPPPSFGPDIAARHELAAAIGLDPGSFAGFPIQVVSCGVPFLFVPIRTRADVDQVTIDQRAFTRVVNASRLEALPSFFFTMDRTNASGDESVYSRMLAPALGIEEDPATGGASGPLGCYLVRHGLVPPDRARSIVSLQGVAMKRPSRVHISIETRDSEISRVRVGGKSVLVAEGHLHV